jgi:hypothetical protein
MEHDRGLSRTATVFSSKIQLVHLMKAITAFLGGVVSTVALTACAASLALSHPNFTNAEQALQSAIGHVQGAQQVNGPNFGGHAGRAIDLIRQAQAEISIADEYHRGVR